MREEREEGEHGESKDKNNRGTQRFESLQIGVFICENVLKGTTVEWQNELHDGVVPNRSERFGWNGVLV